ncbi:MAG: hypothetical protein ACK4EX_08720 [Thermaurantimonas sp.]|uniref:hypothetical protein n=1 Tax=Thermaurantimonas sp. TaxID=2681568 RepID=UPI00391D50F9
MGVPPDKAPVAPSSGVGLYAHIRLACGGGTSRYVVCSQEAASLAQCAAMPHLLRLISAPIPHAAAAFGRFFYYFLKVYFSSSNFIFQSNPKADALK